MSAYDGDGTPIQRSMLKDKSQYKTSNLSINKKGIVLEVKYSDNASTRAAMSKNDRRGWQAEAVVWLVDDCAILPHVMIPPSSPSGLDDYEENLPRASTRSVDGIQVDENISNVDPNDLDGDWCVVSFMEGNIQDPFISNWWANPRNVYDPATSGKGNPKFGTGKGTALDQRGRYFKRTNGIETTITKQGNIILSTTRAGSTIKPGSTSNDGRFPRSTFDGGGSIITYIKPSQTFEIAFDPQVDGYGPETIYDPSLPQSNPSLSPAALPPATNTKLKASKSEFKVFAPTSIQLRSKSTALMEAPKIYLGENAVMKAAKDIPTMANFNALLLTVNALVAAVNAPLVVQVNIVSGTGATTPAVPSVAPPAPLQEVAATKVFVE